MSTFERNKPQEAIKHLLALEQSGAPAARLAEAAVVAFRLQDDGQTFLRQYARARAAARLSKAEVTRE